MSTTRIRDRIFALVGVLVIVISVGALSVAVIIQDIMTRNASTADTQSQPPAITCVDSATEPTFAAPDKFTVSQPVGDVQSTDLTEGTGAAAKNGDCLVVKYYGMLAKDGTMFDENYTKPEGFAFTLGKGDVIVGWDKGLVGMKVGGERRLVIPAAQAYGNEARGNIPANADLVFYVKLLRIQS